MWICVFRSLSPRIALSLLLSLLLLLTVPAVVQASTEPEASVPDCAAEVREPQPVTVQMSQSDERVQTTLHSPSSALPAAGCRVSLEFHIPEDHRPPYAVWRDVGARAVLADGTPDPVRLRLWIQPDGNLEYEVRDASLKATHAVLDLEVAWGTTAAANDRAVLDIFSSALGLLNLSPQELGVFVDHSGRVTVLDWVEHYPDGYWEFLELPKWPLYTGIRSPGVRVEWQLPSELGQLTDMYKLVLGGPLLTGTIPPELGRLKNLDELALAGSRLTGSVPPELGQLEKLRFLRLHNNRLTGSVPLNWVNYPNYIHSTCRATG